MKNGPSPRGEPRRGIRPVLIAGVLTALVAAIYLRTLNHAFVAWDDTTYLTRNPRVLQGITADNLRWAFTTNHAANWHPLTWLSHMADVDLFGREPRGHHLVNTLLHAANVVLLFRLLGAATGALWCSAFVAALFAVHPLHVESVAWVAERKDLLSTFFGLLAIGAYLRSVRRRGSGASAAAAGLFALSLMAKPMMVTLPFLLLLLDVWPLGRFPRAVSRGVAGTFADSGRLLLEKTPLLLLTGLSGVMTWWAQTANSAVESLEFLPFSLRVMNALESYAVYIGKAFWPSGLAVHYPHPGFIISTSTAILAGVGLAAVTAGVLFLARRRPYLIIGWLWYLGTLVPVIGLVQVGVQARADRYTYLPLTGLFIMAAWGLGAAARNRPLVRLGLGVGGVAAILALTTVATIQAGYWSDSIRLFSRALAVTSENGLMHYNLAVALNDQGRKAEALPHFQAADRIKPYFANLRGPAWANLPVWRYTVQTPDRIARARRETQR